MDKNLRLFLQAVPLFLIAWAVGRVLILKFLGVWVFNLAATFMPVAIGVWMLVLLCYVECRKK